MKNKKKGITLIELVITMAVMGLLMATVTIVFSANSDILNKVDKKSELQLDAQMLQEALSTVVLECSGIATDSSDNELILFDSKEADRRHVFKLEDSSLSYQVIKVTEGAEPQVIQTKTLSTHVKSFSYGGNEKMMKYSIELEISKGNKSETLNMENQIVFRN